MTLVWVLKYERAAQHAQASRQVRRRRDEDNVGHLTPTEGSRGGPQLAPRVAAVDCGCSNRIEQRRSLICVRVVKGVRKIAREPARCAERLYAEM